MESYGSTEDVRRKQPSAGPTPLELASIASRLAAVGLLEDVGLIFLIAE